MATFHYRKWSCVRVSLLIFSLCFSYSSNLLPVSQPSGTSLDVPLTWVSVMEGADPCSVHVALPLVDQGPPLHPSWHLFRLAHKIQQPTGFLVCSLPLWHLFLHTLISTFFFKGSKSCQFLLLASLFQTDRALNGHPMLHPHWLISIKMVFFFPDCSDRYTLEEIRGEWNLTCQKWDSNPPTAACGLLAQEAGRESGTLHHSAVLTAFNQNNWFEYKCYAFSLLYHISDFYLRITYNVLDLWIKINP